MTDPKVVDAIDAIVDYLVKTRTDCCDEVLLRSVIAKRDALIVRKPLTHKERELLDAITSTEGYELYILEWPTAERLAAKGYIRLSGKRGPGGLFKRAEVIC
jgi:hypothetical protein